MNTTIFETSFRKLEQFLFMHEIHHISFYKREDGMTVWQYNRTPETMRIVGEWREIQARKREGRGLAHV